MLLLQTVIFSLFKSLEAFNELSWDDAYKIFWINRFVFFDLAVTNGCFSEKSFMRTVWIHTSHFPSINQQDDLFPCIGKS